MEIDDFLSKIEDVQKQASVNNFQNMEKFLEFGPCFPDQICFLLVLSLHHSLNLIQLI